MSIFMKPRQNLRILVVQHSEDAPGANFTAVLQSNGCSLTTIKPLTGDPVPENTSGYGGLVVLGGPQHATDDHLAPHFPALMELMRKFERNGKPVAGICLGCQLLARAYGKDPKALGSLEIGFTELNRTPEAMSDPVLSAIAVLPPLMEFHEDTFDLPTPAVLLITGERCRNQCFRIGQVSYGFQFHLEVDRATVERWLHKFQQGEMAEYDRYRKEFSRQGLNDLESRLDGYIAESELFCATVAKRWLALAECRTRTWASQRHNQGA